MAGDSNRELVPAPYARRHIFPNISPVTEWRWRQRYADTFPRRFKVGHYVYYYRDEIEAWLERFREVA